MTTRLVVLSTFVLSAFLGCNKSPQPADSQAPPAHFIASMDPRPLDSVLDRPFDTLAVTKALALTRADSIVLHLVPSRLSPDPYSTDELSIQKVTDNLPPFYFRLVTASSGQFTQTSGQVAYLLIYAPVNDPGKVKRFHQDSISFEESMQEGFQPQLTVTDINRDGVNDLIVSILQDMRYDLLDCNFFHHYDTLSASIVADSALDAQFGRQIITFDEAKKEISTGYITGNGQYEFEVYRWDGKGYPLFAKKHGERPDDNPGILVETREELHDGKWTEVKRDTTQ